MHCVMWPPLFASSDAVNVHSTMPPFPLFCRTAVSLLSIANVHNEFLLAKSLPKFIFSGKYSTTTTTAVLAIISTYLYVYLCISMLSLYLKVHQGKGPLYAFLLLLLHCVIYYLAPNRYSLNNFWIRNGLIPKFHWIVSETIVKQTKTQCSE